MLARAGGRHQADTLKYPDVVVEAIGRTAQDRPDLGERGTAHPGQHVEKLLAGGRGKRGHLVQPRNNGGSASAHAHEDTSPHVEYSTRVSTTSHRNSLVAAHDLAPDRPTNVEGAESPRLPHSLRSYVRLSP